MHRRASDRAGLWQAWQLRLRSDLVMCGLPGRSGSKESACNAGDPGLIPGWEDPWEKGMATQSNILA